MILKKELSSTPLFEVLLSILSIVAVKSTVIGYTLQLLSYQSGWINESGFLHFLLVLVLALPSSPIIKVFIGKLKFLFSSNFCIALHIF